MSEVTLVDVGVGRRGRDGSERYGSLLRTSLLDSGVAVSRVSPRFAGRWVERAILGAWSGLGYPDPSSRVIGSSHGGAVLHSVESISVPRSAVVPLVVTVHDVCALVRPELVSDRIAVMKGLSWRRQREWAAVIVRSTSTRTDVIELGVEPSRITVIGQPVGPAFLDEAPTSAAGEPFVLAVSPPSDKKGTDVLIRAVSRLRPRHGSVILVTSDSDVLHRYEHASELLRDGSIVIRTGLGDRDLVALYKAAHAVIVPSRWEGYSLPVAEALAVGTGVIASDIPAHREFVSSAIALYPSEDDLALADLIRQALEVPVRRDPQLFTSVDAFTRQHLEVYERVTS
jgi:glycosyltransferase involved in cell wall biosynthesis